MPPRSLARVEPRASRGGEGLHRRRTQDTALTADNTHPIELVLDFASLYPATAQVYSTCFEAGAWYTRGSPGPVPPLNGLPTCVRGPGEWLVGAEGCWGRCTEADLLTPGARALIEHVTREVAREVSGLLSVRTPDAALRFVSTPGAAGTARQRAANGYATLERCASDCQTGFHVAVDSEFYCAAGVRGDAVLSVTRPPPIEGVAGSGSACVTGAGGDQRPRWLVLAWLQGTAGVALAPCAPGFGGECIAPTEALARWRGLVMHEILHALGFSGGRFQVAPAPGGEGASSLLALGRTEDVDGSSDEVWHFSRGSRAYAAARDYFGCTDPDWLGVPLMGAPELGRNSHWETRIMRDDVMSYGHQSVVSAVTLGAMEDLGFYLANYSAAGCMAWGYQQGCGFVTSRCGVYPETGVRVTVAEDPHVARHCGGDPAWPAWLDPYLQQKCGYGADPCGSFSYAGGFDRDGCDAQCYTGTAPGALALTGRTDCARHPGPSRAGTLAESSAYALGLSFTTWLWGGILVLLVLVGAAVAFRCCGSCLAPAQGSAGLLTVLSAAIGGGGVALSATATALALGGTSATLMGDTPLFGHPSLVGAAVTGGGVAITSLLTLLGVCLTSPRLLLASGLLQVLGLVVGLVVAAALLYYAWALGTIGTGWGDGSDGRYSGRTGSTVLAQLEGALCQGYLECCRDPRLGNASGMGMNETCDARAVNSTDLSTILRDASHPRFCEIVAGSTYGLASVAPPEALCAVLADGYDIPACQVAFCAQGAGGYVAFANAAVAWTRDNAAPLGLAVACLFATQILSLVNTWRLRSRYIQAKLPPPVRVVP